MKPKKERKPERDAAEAIAAHALCFIAGDSARLGRFLAESGLGPENVRRAATDPAFLPAVLDFILAHEADLLGFSAQQGIDPRHVSAARGLLPGANSNCRCDDSHAISSS